MRRFSLLFLLITRLYRSFRSDVANRPPSKGTRGRNSGGITGTTSKIIHSGRQPDSIKASISFNLLTYFFLFISEPVVRSPSRISTTSCSKSSSLSISLSASAPIEALNVSSPNSSIASKYSSSDNSCLRFNEVNPSSKTTKLSKYKIRSNSLSVISRSKPIRLGNDLRNQICATGEASSICPIRSRRTLLRVTSTPHFSQIIPLNFIRLYFPHRHS